MLEWIVHLFVNCHRGAEGVSDGDNLSIRCARTRVGVERALRSAQIRGSGEGMGSFLIYRLGLIAAESVSVESIADERAGEHYYLS